MNKIIKYIAAITLIISSISFGQIDRSISKVGTTSAAFLKINPGARAVGMGGAYTAVSNDIYSSYYNAAGMALINGNGQVAFNHSNWLADISYDYAAASINLEGMGSMFVTLSSLSVPKEEVRTFAYPDGDGRFWDAKSLSIGVGFARRLTDRFSIGLQFKYIQEKIWNSTANGFAIDVGTYYITPFNDLVIGASVNNFGSKMQLDGRDIQFNEDPDGDGNQGPNNIPAKYETNKYDIPLNFKVGLSMNVLESRYFTLKTAVDAIHPNDNEEYMNVGTELSLYDMLYLRTGYQKLFWDDDNGENGMTFGVGFQYKMNSNLIINVNYAFADFNRLEKIHMFDISLTY